MSLLRAARRLPASKSLRVLGARFESSSSSVEVDKKEGSEVTHHVPPKEPVTADFISGAPGMVITAMSSMCIKKQLIDL